MQVLASSSQGALPAGVTIAVIVLVGVALTVGMIVLARRGRDHRPATSAESHARARNDRAARSTSVVVMVVLVVVVIGGVAAFALARAVDLLS